MTSPVWSACRRAVLFEIGRKISRLILAFFPQYFEFLTRISLSPTVQDLNMYGPVPVGWRKPYEPSKWTTPPSTWAALALYFFSAFGLAIPKFPIEAAESIGANLALSVMIAVYFPFALQFLNKLGVRLGSSL